MSEYQMHLISVIYH